MDALVSIVASLGIIIYIYINYNYIYLIITIILIIVIIILIPGLGHSSSQNFLLEWGLAIAQHNKWIDCEKHRHIN